MKSLRNLLLSLLCFCLFASASFAVPNATAVWRVRPSGSNTNGGGFDCYISSAATGSNGSWSTTSGTTTFTDTTAANFTSGMVGSSINIPGVGQYSVLTYVSTTQITITTPSPATSNVGGSYSWAVGAGQDYSQQNSYQIKDTSTSVTSTATTTLTDTGASFTSALIGNAIYVAGSGITTTYTYITAVPTGTTLTLQTSPGTTGTTVTYYVGGGWADFYTNTTSAAQIQPGNIIYILGSKVPTPSSYTYDYTRITYVAIANGSATAGCVQLVGDPATPSGGVPCIKTGGLLIYATAFILVKNLYFVASGTSTNIDGTIYSTSSTITGCVLDQFGYDIGLTAIGVANVIGCEVFSSVAKRSTNALYAITTASVGGVTISGNNIHNCIGPGISVTELIKVSHNIVANCGSNGITIQAPVSAAYAQAVSNNTIDANSGSGIVFVTQAAMSITPCYNNLITNSTTGITCTAGTLATNSLVQQICNYNTFYGNTANYSGINPGANDTVLSATPYIAQSTENYNLNTANISATAAFPDAPFLQYLSGQTTTVQSYLYPGAVQPQSSGGSSAQIFSSGFGF